MKEEKMRNYTMPFGYTACYVDDKSSEAMEVINRLNAVGGLDVSYLAPSQDLSLAGIRPGTQLFLVDWELNGLQDEGTQVDYNGGTFAGRLREKFEELPIILTSNESTLSERKRRRLVDSYLFDAHILKDDIAQKPACVVAKCVNLITGFEKLSQADKTWPGLMSVLEVNREDEEEQIGEAAPPLLKLNGGNSWLVPEIANWIQDVLLAYPGILYNPLHAASYLGIDVEEFLTPSLQEFFKDAHYTGAFAPSEGRWWKKRLASVARRLMIEAGRAGLSIYLNFAPAFAELHGRELQPSECVYSKKKHADWVCYVLKEPVLFEYTLTYLPDNRPQVMDAARVSFTAIQTSEDVFDEYIDSSNRFFLTKIRRGETDEL
jgi:hypothetical protein